MKAIREEEKARRRRILSRTTKSEKVALGLLVSDSTFSALERLHERLERREKKGKTT